MPLEAQSSPADADHPAQNLDPVRDLQRYEKEISTHLVNAFVATGKALREIRDNTLYKQGPYGTFDEYVRRRWYMERTYAHRLIHAAEVYENLLPIGNTAEGSVPLPTSEAQVRPLVRLDPDSQRKAWREAVNEIGSYGVPTAGQVERAAAVVLPPKRKERTKHLPSINLTGSPATEIAESPAEVPRTDEDTATSLAVGTSVAATPVTADLEQGVELQLQNASGDHLPPEVCNSGEPRDPKSLDLVATALDASNLKPGTQPSPVEDGVGNQPVVAKDEPFPADKVRQAIHKVRVRELTSLDELDLSAHVRRMVPIAAEVLNRYAREFPDVEAHDLSRALGIANAKLQLQMDWM